MTSASEINDEETLRAWLETRPREDAVLLARRSAMRVLPLWGAEMATEWARKEGLTALPLLRCGLISAVAASVLAQRSDTYDAAAFAATTSARYALSNAKYAVSDAKKALARAAHAAFADASTEADSATDAANAANTAALAVLTGASGADAALYAASIVNIEYTDEFDVQAACWRALKQDAIGLENGDDLFRTPLWPDAAPDCLIQATKQMLQIWDADPVSRWAFWRRWWDSVIVGRPLNPLLQRAIVKGIDDEAWSDPDAVASRILEIESQFSNSSDVDLYTATLFDFTFDKMAGVMRAVPLPEDWEHLNNSERLSDFLTDAGELREKLDLMCSALRAEGRAMQGAGIVATYTTAVLDELKRAENIGELRVGMLMEYGRILESAANSDEVNKEFGLLASALKSNVECLRGLIRDHFAYTLARSSILKSIRLEDDVDPVRVLSLFRDLVLEAKEARASKLVPMSKEDAAVLADILDSVDDKIRALAVSDDAENRSSLKRDMDFQMAKVGATYAVYRDRAKVVSKGAGDVSDDVLKWSKRGEGLWALARRLWDSLSG